MPIRYELDDHAALITIDRPEARNALDLDHYRQLAAGWERARQDPAVRVIVITGVGDSFCAGADLKTFIPTVTAHLAAGTVLAPDDAVAAERAVLRNSDLYKPIVAAVNGFCLASGMEMLLGTDIRIASTTARFGLPEVRWGLFASGGSTVRLPRQLPLPYAMEILLTGQPVSAEEACRYGLVNRVVEPHALLDEARRVARVIATNSPTAVSATKRSVLRGLALDDAYALELEISDQVFAGPDAREGPRAFAEKRTPAWVEQ
jgi:enoyl-CoA hydratase